MGIFMFWYQIDFFLLIILCEVMEGRFVIFYKVIDEVLDMEVAVGQFKVIFNLKYFLILGGVFMVQVGLGQFCKLLECVVFEIIVVVVGSVMNVNFQ